MKAIIFDCDGTLVDSELIHYNAWKHVLKERGAEFTLDEYFTYVGTATEACSKILAAKYNVADSFWLAAEKEKKYFQTIEEGVPPIQGTLDFLKKLIKEQSKFGYKLAIASGAPKKNILLYLKHLNVESHFEVIVSGEDDLKNYVDKEGTNKPKPYIYLEAAKQLGLKPCECVAIEDSTSGVQAAVAAGCFAIAIPSAFSLNHDFRAAHLQLDSFETMSVDTFISTLNKLMRCYENLF